MKIGIVTSWVDMLVLFRFLAKYDFSYEIYYDDLWRPWSDKTFVFNRSHWLAWIDYLIEQGCDKIIVPPLIELAFHHTEKYADVIIPLYHEYIMGCMQESAVWKIWYAAEYLDMICRWVFEWKVLEYQPDEKQLARVAEIQKKKPAYKWEVNFRFHEISMWKYYLTKLSFKSQIVHHAMKADWRYFKDAWVDTIIPTSYGFFAYETILWKFLNTKKQTFHWLSLVESWFTKLAKDFTQTRYHVHIHYTWTLDHLLREKKWVRMLQRGKEIELTSQNIMYKD